MTQHTEQAPERTGATTEPAEVHQTLARVLRLAVCGAPATTYIEIYAPRNGGAHGSLDGDIHLCVAHAEQAQAAIHAAGLTAYTPVTGCLSGRHCGDGWDFGVDRLGGAPLHAPPAPATEPPAEHSAASSDPSADEELQRLVQDGEVLTVQRRTNNAWDQPLADYERRAVGAYARHLLAVVGEPVGDPPGARVRLVQDLIAMADDSLPVDGQVDGELYYGLETVTKWLMLVLAYVSDGRVDRPEWVAELLAELESPDERQTQLRDEVAELVADWYGRSGAIDADRDLAEQVIERVRGAS